MTEVKKIFSFDEYIDLQRNLGSITNQKEGATIIAFGGIHGNERAGVHALIHVFDEINKKKIPLYGNFYGIAGNLNALEKNIRFENVDLNRIWKEDNLKKIKLTKVLDSENKELKEIYTIIKTILQKHKGPFYFLDLHTTSSKTQPFITISDSLNNRSFSSNFNIPTILGIEEFLEGPLLTFINEFGHVALGFEAGQHEAQSSVKNCEAFLWLSLIATQIIHKKDLEQYNSYLTLLAKHNLEQEFYEIDFKHTISPSEDFKMLPNFTNFQKIKQGEVLAIADKMIVNAPISGRIFMPLYQNKGEDGFFIIRKISKIWLHISRLFRKLKFDAVLRILPGVKASKENKYTLIVNRKTAKFLALEIFHLFGYRKKVLKNDYFYFIRRDRSVRKFS